MRGSNSSKITRASVIRKIRELLESAEFVDDTLEEELNQILADLTAYPERLETVSDEAQERLERLELFLKQLHVRVQGRKKVAASVWRRDEGTATLPPKNLIEILKRSGSLDAQQAAEELERMILLLTELTKGMFRGNSAKRIRNYARDAQEELLGIKEGELSSYWRFLLDFGAEKAVESIERDPGGGDLRKRIEEGAIDLDEIVATVWRLIQRAESIASKRFLVDVERELNEGLLEYIVPREKRDPGDPFIVRLAKYVDPNAVLNSRLVTPFEKSLRGKSIDLLKEVLQTIDEIAGIATRIKSQTPEEGGWLRRKLQQQDELMEQFFETTNSINVAHYQEETETEAAYLNLLLRRYCLLKLRDRLALFHAKLLEEAPAKLLVAYLNRKIIRYMKEVIEYTKQENLRELQKGINELRTALQAVGARFSLEQEVTAFVEALQPDYALLFPHGASNVLKRFIGFSKALNKRAENLKKVATKKKPPENAWKELQDQMEGLQKEIRAR